MSDLYFLGIKKSSIKKMIPVKYLFDWRDRRLNQRILNHLIKNYKVEEGAGKEGKLLYPLNGKELALYFRKFPVSDLSVLDQVFLQHCYLPMIEQIMRDHPENTPLKIIDAGANVGYASVFFCSYFQFSKIVAIEPDEANFQQLLINTEANFCDVTCIMGALWYKEAFLEVVRDFRDNREAALTVKETTKNTAIRGYSFNDILTLQGWNEADLLKIDIEGGERFLFDSEENADAILGKIKYLAIEIHDEFKIRTTIYDHLDRHGFTYFEFSDLTLAVKNG